VTHRRPTKECPHEEQLIHTSSSQEIAAEHPHRPVGPPRRASSPAARRNGRQVAATVAPAHGDRPAFAQHDHVVGPDGVLQHDRHHEVRLESTRRKSRRRSAEAAARLSTARLSTARILRIATTGPRNKFAPIHARSPPAHCSCMRLTRTITCAQFACAQATSFGDAVQRALAPLVK